jgi:hypothetical protein
MSTDIPGTPAEPRWPVVEVAPNHFVEPGNLGPEEIEHRFGFHKATIEGENATLPIHTELRLNFREFAEYLDQQIPNGRAKSTMFTNLENASMWAHKAVAETAPLVEEQD